MKKFLKQFTCLIAAVIMSFSFVACDDPSTNGGGDDDGGFTEGGGSTTILDAMEDTRPSGDNFDYVSDYVTPEPPEVVHAVVPDPDPAYANGGQTTKTRLEAEHGVVALTNNLTGSNEWKNEYSDVNNLAFDFRLSNGFATRNLNNTTGTTITFEYTSNKTYTVKTNLMISVWDDKRCPFTVGDYISIATYGFINGEQVYNTVDLSTTVIEWEDTEILVSGGDVNDLYWHFKEVEINVALFKGENQLVIDMIGAGGANIDYLEFDTSATVSDFDDTFYMESDKDGAQNVSRWYVSTYPTETTAGTLTVEKMILGQTRVYNYGLPAIKDDGGNVTNGYYVKDLGGGKTAYAFKFKNKEIVLDVNKDVTVTLKDYPNVKFANGTGTLTKVMGSALAVSDLQAFTDGREIALFNVYDKSNNLIGTAVPGSWKFPDIDVTLEVVSYKRVGFTLLDPGNEQGTRKPQSNTSYGGGAVPIENFSNSATHAHMIKGSSDWFAEAGNLISYNGTMATNVKFRVNTVVNSSTAVVTLGKPHQFAYNFENMGTSRIHLRLNQVNSGGYTEDGDEGVIIDLDPGESMTVVITISFALGGANKNALSLFTVLSECVNMKLGMSMSVKLAK